MNEIIPRH